MPAQGYPPVPGFAASKHFAATLLILREFMHHLQFAGITIFEPLPA